jgi:hypothetical protein
MAHAIILGGKTEIEADGLGVPNMQITVWLREKAGNDAATVFVLPPVFGNDVADKVRGGRRIGFSARSLSTLVHNSGRRYRGL